MFTITLINNSYNKKGIADYFFFPISVSNLAALVIHSCYPTIHPSTYIPIIHYVLICYLKIKSRGDKEKVACRID